MPVSVIYFPQLSYNCEKAVYPLTPLSDSIISGGIVFAFKVEGAVENDNNAILAIALNLKTNIDEHNYYKSVERLKNLACLAYTILPEELLWNKVYNSLREAVNTNLADKFYNPGVRFGMQLTWDLPFRVAAYSQRVARLNKKNQTKFWNALQTFSYARLIARLPNPQYKYTLYMSLHLASINQLANDPQDLHTPSLKLSCPKCGVTNMAHQTSHVEEIIRLIKKLIPLEHQKLYINFITKLFHPIRSGYIHRGKFVGKEEIGGFIAQWNNETLLKQLSEKDVNLMVFNRTLLEQFLEKNSA